VDFLSVVVFVFVWFGLLFWVLLVFFCAGAVGGGGGGVPTETNPARVSLGHG